MQVNKWNIQPVNSFVYRELNTLWAWCSVHTIYSWIWKNKIQININLKCKCLHWCHCSMKKSIWNDSVCFYMEGFLWFFLGGGGVVTEVIQLGGYFDKVRLKYSWQFASSWLFFLLLFMLCFWLTLKMVEMPSMRQVTQNN